MNAYTSNASLVIHPADPNWVPESSDNYVIALKNVGLISDKLKDNASSYLVGDHFLDLIAFMGCSPNINLTPEDNPDAFCSIRLITTDTITSLTSQHTHPPNCPICKKPVKNWIDTINNSSLACPYCGESSPPWDYNWRKSAGFGRCFIEITEIYPKEAIPQPALLTTLYHLSHTDWKYFYLHSLTKHANLPTTG